MIGGDEMRQGSGCDVEGVGLRKYSLLEAGEVGQGRVRRGIIGMGGDTTRNCAGTVAANFVYYFRNLK